MGSIGDGRSKQRRRALSGFGLAVKVLVKIIDGLVEALGRLSLCDPLVEETMVDTRRVLGDKLRRTQQAKAGESS